MPGIFKINFFGGKQKPFDVINHLCTVKFLDDSDAISFTYQRTTKGRLLLDHVCSTINLIEKDYFGLKYTDAEKQECWLDQEKTIYSQIKGLSNPVLYFQVRFYPADLESMKEEITRYHLFLQVRKDFNEQRLICSLQEALHLSALAIQEQLGDFDHIDNWHDNLDKVKLPPGLVEYESYLVVLHKQLKGLSQSGAESKFLEKTVSLSSYGIDPYVVSDTKGNQMYLSVAPQGLIIFQDNLPTKTYQWHDVMKLTFDGKSFHIKQVDKENFTRGNILKNNVNTSLFACTSSNKKPQQQQTTVTYKCLSHTNCKQLWKNAMAYKYFYTLQSSSEAPKVLSSGGLFNRGSKFRYSGSCLAELRTSSASINREEPKVTRRLSTNQIDEDIRHGGTLPRKWKLETNFPEDTSVTKPLTTDTQMIESIEEVSKKHANTAQRTSSDSALGSTPANCDLKTPSLLPQSGGKKHEDTLAPVVDNDKRGKEYEFSPISFTEPLSVASHTGIHSLWSSNCEPYSIMMKSNVKEENEDEMNRSVDHSSAVHGNLKHDINITSDKPSAFRSLIDSTANDKLTTPSELNDSISSPANTTITHDPNFVYSRSNHIATKISDTNRPFVQSFANPNSSLASEYMGSNNTSLFGEVGSNTSRDDSTDITSEEGSFKGAPMHSRSGVEILKRNRQESSSGYDTGYMSSGSERMSRSFENDEPIATDIGSFKGHGIVEEMEFPASNDGWEGSETISDFNEIHDRLEQEKASCALLREELLSLLSYGSEGIASMNLLFNENLKKDKYDGDEINDLTPTSSSPIGDLSSSSSSPNSYPFLKEASPRTTRSDSNHSESLPHLLNLSPNASKNDQHTSYASGHSLTSGVFSSDNFKRIKEIEKMIEDNKNKIQEMKEAITFEIKKSISDNATGSSNEPLVSRPTHQANMAYSKQPKHVSFSSHDSEWQHRESEQPFIRNLKSWIGMEAINRNNDDVTSQERDKRLEDSIEFTLPSQGELSSGVKMESIGAHLMRGNSDVVEKFPSSEGVFVKKAEMCRFSDDDMIKENDDDKNKSFEIFWENTMCDPTVNIETSSHGFGSTVSSTSDIKSSTKDPMRENKFEEFTYSETVIEEVFKITNEDIFRSLYMPTSSNTPTSKDSSVDVMTCEYFPCVDSEHSVISTEDNAREASVVWGEKCTSTKDCTQVPGEDDGENKITTSSSAKPPRNVMKSVCGGVGKVVMSAGISFILLIAFLITIFEFNQEIPYVTDQESVMDLKKSVYEPAREQLVKFFKE